MPVDEHGFYKEPPFIQKKNFGKPVLCKSCYAKQAGDKNARDAFGKGGMSNSKQLEHGTCSSCGLTR